MAIYNLVKARGKGVPKFFIGVVAITGTGSVDTGLSSLDGAVATVQDSALALPTNTASVTSISGGTVNIVVTQHATAANSVETVAKDVCVIAAGE